MYKKKTENINEKNTEFANNMNFDLPDERMEQIDLKLESLLHIMKYEDYVQFIKSDEKLKIYDELLGKYANNDTTSKVLINGFNNEMYEYLNKIIDDKLKELILQRKSP